MMLQYCELFLQVPYFACNHARSDRILCVSVYFLRPVLIIIFIHQNGSNNIRKKKLILNVNECPNTTYQQCTWWHQYSIVQTGKCMLVWNKLIISQCQNFKSFNTLDAICVRCPRSIDRLFQSNRRCRFCLTQIYTVPKSLSPTIWKILWAYIKTIRFSTFFLSGNLRNIY